MINENGFKIGDKQLSLMRWRFQQACKQRGKRVKYYEPIDIQPNLWNEWSLKSDKYKEAIDTCVMYHEHVKQWTMKKFGRVNEIESGHPIIEVPYDIPIIHGGIFLIPSGINGVEHKPYRVAWIANVDTDPIHFTAELAPIFTGEEIERQATDGKVELYNQLIKSEDDD